MLALLGALVLGQAPTADVLCHDLTLDSRILQGNPLKDPTRRHIAVFRPAGTESRRLPLILYLPGFGGSSDDALADHHPWSDIVADLHTKGADVVFAVVDGRNRYGCSQYIDSPSSGRYLDYLCDEVLPFVEKAENCGGSLKDRMVVGHSSGGFGALRLGMARQNLFGGVVALSPDSYFDVTHKPFTVDPEVAKVPLDKIRAVSAPTFARLDTLPDAARYPLALCDDYAGNKDGTFDWLYDAQGQYRNEVYERWRDQDPAVIASRTRRPFSSKQRVYLEGAAQDDFKANQGAAKVAEELTGKGVVFTTYFPPGHHSDHLRERIVRGVGWVSALPLEEIRGSTPLMGAPRP